MWLLLPPWRERCYTTHPPLIAGAIPHRSNKCLHSVAPKKSYTKDVIHAFLSIYTKCILVVKACIGCMRAAPDLRERVIPYGLSHQTHRDSTGVIYTLANRILAVVRARWEITLPMLEM